MADVLVIKLYPRESECCWCGADLADPRFGLPMYEGEVLPNDHAGEWAGFDACERCYLIHQAGGPGLLAKTVERTA